MEASSMAAEQPGTHDATSPMKKSRKTRFVCISDTHNASPEDGCFKLPKGDVLIHAGDLTKQGSLAELRRTLDWVDKADFEVKLVTAGNHDITLDPAFYNEHGLHFHNQHPEDPQACIDLVKSYRSIQFLNHESATIRLSKPDGPKTVFNVFGSPFSIQHDLWAFGYSSDAARELWDRIPLTAHVVVTHTPPKYHCDESGTGASLGCEVLRQTLWRVRPSLAICGHIHEARGAQRVMWDLDSPNVKYKESATGYWEDPGQNNKKQSLIDLGAKSRNPLQNSGPFDDFPQNARVCSLTEGNNARVLNEPINAGATPAVWGQGGPPSSGRCDQEALAGRTGRRETCIVNAAIMATSWPYQSRLARKYNKPVVVDLELPVWDE